MFNRILNSMSEMIVFIEQIKFSIKEGYKIADDVFRNTSSEYVAIEGFIEESLQCRNEASVNKNKIFNERKFYCNEKLTVLMKFDKDFKADPFDVLYENEKLICNNIFDKLFKESVLGTPIPELAKGWTDEEAKIWTIYLKDNIYFSNGELFTAEYVEFSMLRCFVGDGCYASQKLKTIEGFKEFKTIEQALREKIDGIKVIDKRTIQIKLNRPDILFLSSLSSNMLGIISKNEYLKNKNIIGTGAYYIHEAKQKDEFQKILKLRSNEYNFKNSPYIKDVEIYMKKNFNEFFERKSNESYDIIYPVPYSKLHVANNINSNCTLEHAGGGQILFVNFIANSRNNVIQDKELRKNVFKILRNMDLDIEELPKYYDECNELSDYWKNSNLKIPNWIDDKPFLGRLKGTINMVTYNNPMTIELAKRMKSVLEKNGLTVKLHIDDDIDALEKYDLSVAVLSKDGYDYYTELYDSIAPPFGSFLIDKPIGKKLESLTTISNYKRKIEMLKDIEVEILKEYYNLPLCSFKSFFIKNKNIISVADNAIANLKLEDILKTK